MSEAEKRLKSCCFTGHRPEKLRRDEAEAVRLLDAAISDDLRKVARAMMKME